MQNLVLHRHTLHPQIGTHYPSPPYLQLEAVAVPIIAMPVRQ
jgi:hypothetical protein